MKKIFALILTTVMLIGVLPLGIFAETTESKVSGVLTWTLDKETMTLTISGEGEMENYLEGKKPNPFFSYRDEITTVIIEEGVTSIGAYAFQNYKRLAGIKMPETLESIGFGAFENTLSLERIEFPKSLKTLSDIFLMSEPVGIMVFKGNVPTLVDWSGFYREDNNNAAYLTRIFYMEDDLTWTEEAKAAFGDGVIWNDDFIVSDNGFTGVTDKELPFEDVKENYWYYNSVEYVYLKGLMTGTAENKFSPNMNLTRAQMVQMLFNMSGESKSDYMGKSSFDDVDALAWYAPAVNWAVENGITSGVSKTEFAPNRNITRQELARFFYVYAGYLDGYYTYPRAEIDNPDRWNAFADTSEIADWAQTPMSWAIAVGLISGMSVETISPRTTATRAQAAQMLKKFDEYIKENKRITTGAFRELADYIVENGYQGGYWPDTYIYSFGIGDLRGSAEYFPSSDKIVLYVCGEQYKEHFITGSHSMCMENSYMTLYGLNSDYEYNYHYYPMGENDDPIVMSSGVFTAEGYNESKFEFGDYVITDDYEHYFLNNEEYTEFATQKRDTAVSAMYTFIDHLLTECGLERADLFITK